MLPIVDSLLGPWPESVQVSTGPRQAHAQVELELRSLCHSEISDVRTSRRKSAPFPSRSCALVLGEDRQLVGGRPSAPACAFGHLGMGVAHAGPLRSDMATAIVAVGTALGMEPVTICRLANAFRHLIACQRGNGRVLWRDIYQFVGLPGS